MKTVLLVIGTRPEAVKMRPPVPELQKYPAAFRVRVCVTGQHRELLAPVLEAFSVTPDYNLRAGGDRGGWAPSCRNG